MASKHGKGHMHSKFYIFNLLWRGMYLGIEGQPLSSDDPHALQAPRAAHRLAAPLRRQPELAAPPPAATMRRPPPTAIEQRRRKKKGRKGKERGVGRWRGEGGGGGDGERGGGACASPRVRAQARVERRKRDERVREMKERK